MAIKKSVFNYTGANQTFTVPPFVEEVMVKVWGAGGGNCPGNSNGGPGGYSTGTLPVSTGQILNVMVGQGGLSNSIIPTYGGGGPGGNDFSPAMLHGGSGGGRSGVSIGVGNQLIIAGGGGGSGGGTANNVWSNGGSGGGNAGMSGWVNPLGNPAAPGGGGTQGAGGPGGMYVFPPNGNGVAGVAFQGGQGGICPIVNAGGGGGGGGGYFGGGGGAGQFTNTPNPLEQDCAGGGGSGYIDPTVINGSTLFTPQNINPFNGGPLTFPPNNNDIDYIAGIGIGGNAVQPPGGGGLVVIIYTQPDLIMNKSVSSDYSDVNETLTYTITINNNGLVTVTNIVFVDTVPVNTTFVANSFTIDGTTIPGTPDPPGVTIPSLGISATSTVQFSVILAATVPSPNAVTNVSTASYTGGFVFNSNSVTTTINHAALAMNKATSSNYSDVGTEITYTIVVNNSGSVEAANVLFTDTIPNDTTFMDGSFSINGATLPGSPNPPGLNIGTIPVGITTVTFKVNIDTIPSPNPIPNSSTAAYNYTVEPSIPNGGAGNANSNIVYTQVNHVHLNLSKSVDKNYATCSDTLKYVIAITNAGNVTAGNVIFKDTIPNGTQLVSNSFTLNGATIPGADPITAGVNINSILAGATSTVTFQVSVKC